MTAALLLWIACVPVHDWPTPVLEWDHASEAFAVTDGYRVYVRDPWAGPGPWQRIAMLPIQPLYDEYEQVCGRWRYGDPVNGMDWPAQRSTDAQAVDVEFGVSAYNASGDSAIVSAQVFCMPRIWPGAPAQYE